VPVPTSSDKKTELILPVSDKSDNEEDDAESDTSDLSESDDEEFQQYPLPPDWRKFKEISKSTPEKPMFCNSFLTF
jgi:hypothetical protein